MERKDKDGHESGEIFWRGDTSKKVPTFFSESILTPHTAYPFGSTYTSCPGRLKSLAKILQKRMRSDFILYLGTKPDHVSLLLP